MEHREANGVGKPANPVAAALSSPSPALPEEELAEWIARLALASGCPGVEAEQARMTYLRARREEGEWLALLVAWWQRRTLEPLPTDAVLAPWASAVHQRILAFLAERGLVPVEAILLPCRGCGRLFASEPPRFARSCGSCKPFAPSSSPHPQGSRTMGFPGFYPAGPYRPARGQSILCAHPDCTRLVLAERSDRRYCDEHARDRKAIARVRERERAQKHERFAFVPHGAEEVRVSFFLEGSEPRIVVGSEGYQATEAAEFFELVQLSAAGQLELRPVLPASALSR